MGGAVASGGWIQSGGHGFLAPRFGLGVDNATQFTIVTSSGSHIEANAYSHPDLFWASRGGGGGTFGVVTSVTYKTHDSLPVSLVTVFANLTSPAMARSIVSGYLRIQPSYVAPNVSMEEPGAVVESFFEECDQRYGLSGRSIQVMSLVGMNMEIVTRLLPRRVMDSDYAKIAEALVALPGGAAVASVSGGAVSEVNPDSAGLNPAWRDTASLISIGENWADGSNGDEIKQVQETLRNRSALLESLSPDAGTYFNEASLYEPNPRHVFLGSHYDKLLSIKQIYDPEELFIVAAGVGWQILTPLYGKGRSQRTLGDDHKSFPAIRVPTGSRERAFQWQDFLPIPSAKWRIVNLKCDSSEH
uniref:Putative FAD binding domain-containing protein n=1 Tax=Moniliophthora roreri TaxID=221103 RepID=A0A0W0EZJ3_MONRR